MAPDSSRLAADPAPSVECGTPSSGRDVAARSRLLLEATETIYLSLDSSSLETTILAEAGRVSGAQKAALLLLRGDVFVAQEVLGISDRCRDLFVVPVEGSVFGRALVDGDTVVVEDMEGGALDGASWRGDCRSIMAAPLQSHRAAYGALALLFPQPRRFDAEEETMLRTFAIHASIALDNRRLMREKDRLAVRDGLTDVYNRGYLELALERSAKDLRRNGGAVSVLFLDVDGMKDVNDTYGHQAGDSVLMSLAQLLQQCCRETDVVARYGGDEFVVFMPDTDAEGARRVVLKVESALARYNATASGATRLSASTGTHTAGADDIEALLRMADRRMYAAKRSRAHR